MSKILLMIKQVRKNPRNSIVFKTVTVVLLTVVITIYMVFISDMNNVSEGLADNLLRLHIVANSDSEQDQALKREVRDVVINYMKELLENSEDIEQTKYIVSSNLDNINQLAKKEMEKYGKNYPIEAMLGSFPFPTKSYGDITLPAGFYQALRVVIGEGDGANWWCVLFPPLCFVDVTHGTVPDSVKEDLQKHLNEEEYKIIVSEDNDEDIPINVKFRLFEIFRDSTTKISAMFGRLFESIFK